MAHWELMIPDDSDVVTEEGAYHAPLVPSGEDPAAGPRKKNYFKQFDLPPFTQNIKLPKKGPNGKVINVEGNMCMKCETMNILCQTLICVLNTI